MASLRSLAWLFFHSRSEATSLSNGRSSSSSRSISSILEFSVAHRSSKASFARDTTSASLASAAPSLRKSRPRLSALEHRS